MFFKMSKYELIDNHFKKKYLGINRVLIVSWEKRDVVIWFRTVCARCLSSPMIVIWESYVDRGRLAIPVVTLNSNILLNYVSARWRIPSQVLRPFPILILLAVGCIRCICMGYSLSLTYWSVLNPPPWYSDIHRAGCTFVLSCEGPVGEGGSSSCQDIYLR